MAKYGSQRSPLIRNYDLDILREIMKEHEIEPQRTGYTVQKDAGFRETIQHTHWYLAPRSRTESPHYRYNRYKETLRRYVKSGNRRVAHIDIGCGAGLFSWVLLDWAAEIGLTYDSVDLYGFDHSPAMIHLATDIRIRLTQAIPDYPSLHYNHDLEDFPNGLRMAWRPNTDYIVTFGHVLAQSYIWTRSSIEDMAQIIDRIIELGSDSACELIAVDARTGRWPRDFVAGWRLLLDNLRQYEHYMSPPPDDPRNLKYGDSMYVLINYQEQLDDLPWDDDGDDLPW